MANPFPHLLDFQTEGKCILWTLGLLNYEKLSSPKELLFHSITSLRRRLLFHHDKGVTSVMLGFKGHPLWFETPKNRKREITLI